MIDTKAPNSPGWWLERLFKRLIAERERRDTLDSYYTGEAGIPIAATKATRESYRRLMALARTNFSELVVEAVRERMIPVGFRTGASDDELGDKEAWRIWQANSLDADSMLVHRSKLVMGDSYVIVGGVDSDTDAPVITPEDPRQVITEEDPVRRRKTRAALKVISDEATKTDWAFLYLPGMVFKAARESRSGSPSLTFDAGSWSWTNLQRTQGGWTGERLPAPVVPVVRFPNRANTFGQSKGEFETHLSILDRINYGILNRLEIVTLQAFRQRAVKGVPTHDNKGNEIDYDNVFDSDPGSMWQLPDTAEMWESGQVDLGPLHTSNRDDIQDLAAVTRTPLFYLTPDATNGSAEGASLAREGLIFKTSDRIIETTESWEQVMSLAFLFGGDEERARRGDMECLWAPPERFSLSERADAASKATDIPWPTRMREIWQFSPQATDRMLAERVAESLLAEPPAPPLVQPPAVTTADAAV